MSRTPVREPAEGTAVLERTDPIEPDETERTRRGRGPGVVVAAIVLLLVMGIAWTALSAMGQSELGQDPFGRVAPDFELPKLEGEGTISLSDLRGSPVVLNFWASWCIPCKQEAPILAAAEKNWRSQGVVFLGVDTQDDRDEAIAFENSYGVEYESAFDPEGSLQVAYGVMGLPETFFIDEEGRIRAKYVGPIDASTLDAYLAQITAD